MKYKIRTSKAFEKDLKRMAKRGADVDELYAVVKLLACGEVLPAKHKDHTLTGDFIGYRECHIRPNWLLVYKIERDVLTLCLFRTGTHSDLF